MHYTVNSFRPHQARETVVCLLHDQRQRKDAASTELDRYAVVDRLVHITCSVFESLSASLAGVRAECLVQSAIDPALLKPL